uniref:Uncharacterized protein n=1 Tax=Zea mays TaxID=4577 RepID=C0P5N6_MAIZE|nr:unknown [Zea mays]
MLLAAGAAHPRAAGRRLGHRPPLRLPAGVQALHPQLRGPAGPGRRRRPPPRPPPRGVRHLGPPRQHQHRAPGPPRRRRQGVRLLHHRGRAPPPELPLRHHRLRARGPRDLHRRARVLRRRRPRRQHRGRHPPLRRHRHQAQPPEAQVRRRGQHLQFRTPAAVGVAGGRNRQGEKRSSKFWAFFCYFTSLGNGLSELNLIVDGFGLDERRRGGVGSA